MSSFIEFQHLFEIPLRNGVTKPKKVRGSGYKMVNMGELFAYSIIDNIEMDRVPLTENEKLMSLLNNEDLLFARQSLVREGAGKCSIFISDNERVCFESHIIRCRLNKKIANPLFYFYFFKSNLGRAKIDSIVEQGAGASGIRGSDLLKIEVPYLSLEQQNYISSVLYQYDKKIQLNTQINQTLEQIAQAIFKSWFIDFDPVKAKAEAKAQGSTDEQASIAAMSVISGKSPDQLNAYKQTNPTDYQQLLELAQAFPSEFEEIDGVEVPKGWEITNFGAVSECFDKKRIPLSKRQREQKIGNIPYYGATSVMDYVNEAIFNDIYLLIGEDGSVLKDDGTPFIQYIWGESWVNNHAHVLKGKDCVSTEHLMLFMSLTNISSYITGAVQMKLNQANMNRIPFIKATNEINILFSKYISSFYEQIRFFSDENKNLMKVRDLLLPKLLSGEV